IMSISFCRRRASELILALTILGCVTLPGARAETRLRLGHTYQPGSLEARMVQQFARRVDEATRGDVRIDLSLGRLPGPEVILFKQVMISGELDLALVQTTLGTVVSSFRLFDLPYLIQDRQQMGRVFTEIIRPILSPQARREGVELLAVIDGGFRQLN